MVAVKREEIRQMTEKPKRQGKKSVLKAEFITPFLSSAKSVLTTMAHVTVAAQPPVKVNTNIPQGDVAGVMSMATNKIVGQLIISFEDETILAIASNMLMEKFTVIDDDIRDTVGEITNMITGGAKSLMSEEHDFGMTRPVSVMKKDYGSLLFNAPIQIIIPYQTSVGPFWVEMGFGQIEA